MPCKWFSDLLNSENLKVALLSYAMSYRSAISLCYKLWFSDLLNSENLKVALLSYAMSYRSAILLCYNLTEK